MDIPKRTQSRLKKELRDAELLAKTQRKDGSEKNVRLDVVQENDLSVWEAKISPAADSLYSGGTFIVSIVCSSQYPIAPPKCKFITPICHPNIHPKTGEICLDVLKNEWSPAWTLHSLCIAILVLLDNPDETSPLDCDSGNLMRSGDTRGYQSLAKLLVHLHANN
eukprot:m.330911 g.330911  ORF g.330911 m.330911 type:complete len:165 (+) comp16605_c0_seq1:1201-1695(+)